MRTSILRVATLAAFSMTFATGAVHAARPLLPAGHADQVPAHLRALPAPKGDIERKPVSFTWALDPQAALEPGEPLLTESREYWMTVEGTELQRGVGLPMSSAGALVRVSPGKGAVPLRGGDFSAASGNRQITIASTADAAELRKAGMDASAGTQVMRMGAGSGAGRATLRAPKAKGRYVVHVFEPQSDRVLHARPERNQGLAGGTMQVLIGATTAGKRAKVDSQALLVAPDGSSRPVAVRAAAGGGQEAVFSLPAHAPKDRGLWELQVFADVDGVPRDVRTAFAIAQPTARFNGIFGLDANRLRVSLPVEAGSAGRYEARGTLYASAPDGSMRPVAQAHSAAWMEAGDEMLVLQFTRSHLPRGYGAPFEVRDLQLNDQSRMAPLESRARAVRF